METRGDTALRPVPAGRPGETDERALGSPVEGTGPGRGGDLRPDRRPRLLIVDDTPTNRKLIRAILRRENYELHEAEDGGRVVEMAREIEPDLILLDIMMPVKDGYTVCEELKEDPRTADIPVIFLTAKAQSEDKIRGLELGAVDYVTKPFSKGEILARVHTHLEIRMLSQSLREMNRQLLHKQRRLDEDLKAAATIQQSLLPEEQQKDRFEQLSLAWRFMPCDKIGGDVFNLYRLDPDHVGLYILDVSGHGVPAAMVTVSVSQRLNPHGGDLMKLHTDEPPYYRLPGPAEVLSKLDREFPVERFDKYFTMCYLILNLRTGRVQYCRAAHPMPVVVRGSGEMETLTAGGSIVGLGGMVPYSEGETVLAPGDRLFLYTDGIVEYPNPEGLRYGDERFREALSAARGRELQKACDGVIESVTRFAGGIVPEDDITLVALEYRGPA